MVKIEKEGMTLNNFGAVSNGSSSFVALNLEYSCGTL